MRTKTWLWLLVIPLCVIAGYLGWRQPIAKSFIAELFGDATNMRIVADAESVQAWKTVGFLKAATNRYPEDFGDFYRKGGEAVPLSKDLATSFSSRLLNFGTYWYHPES